VSVFEHLAADAQCDPDRTVRPGQITPILEQPYPGWYLDRDGFVLGANLLAFQLWGAARPGDLFGASASEVYARARPADALPCSSATTPQPFAWSHALPVVTRISRWDSRTLRLRTRLRLVEGDWGAVVEFAADNDEPITSDLLHTWEKRAIRLWGQRSYVQYDLSRFREYAFAMKEVGLTRYRNRREELAPHAVLDLVRDALEESDVLWKSATDVAERTGLPTAQVSSAIRALHDFGGEVVRAPVGAGAGRRGFTTREHLAHAGPRWQRLASRIGEWRP
jgi:hypothetical protein